nr:outer membrane beta-barrel protein [Gammaproteobacteria bacterium]
MKKTDWNKSLTCILSALAVTVSGGMVSSVWATDTSSGSSAGSASTTTKAKKPGFYTDSFHILPEIQVTAYHDDNIYATDKATESDIVGILSPTLKIKSLWDTHSLKLNAGANIGRYRDNSSEDYEDLWIDANGRYELSTATSLFGGAGYNKKHEGRDAKGSAQSADEPTTYDVLSAQLGGRHNLADYVLRLGFTFEKLDFDNVGTLINDDRDRTHTGAGLRVTRALDKQTRLFAQGLLNQRDYDEQQDQNGWERSSKGYKAAVGLISKFGKKDRLEAFVGLLSQDYDDDRFDTVTEPDFGVSLRWYPAETFKFTGSLNRTLSETTEDGASGYLYTNLNLQLDKKLFKDFVGYLSYGYGESDYQ